MQVGWMRVSERRDQALTYAATCQAVAQADSLGLHQIYLAGQMPDLLADLPRTNRVRIGLDLTAFAAKARDNTAEAIRAAHDRLDGRLVIGLMTGQTVEARTMEEVFGAHMSDYPSAALYSDLPMEQPQPDVLSLPRPGTAPDLRTAVTNGLHVLSPAWNERDQLARHWPDIVAGATHARRRARPLLWHVARCIYVSSDRAQVDAYKAGPAKAYLRRAGVRTDRAASLVIAGSAQHVAEQVRDLRTHIGPFGTLHCIDPGLEPATAARQRELLMTQVLPQLEGATPVASRQLERT